MTEQMKAAVIDTYKQPLPTLKMVSLPVMGPNDVLVKIIAASVNPIDLKTKDGGLKMLLPYQLPLIMGSDFAGIITKVGSQVTNYQTGDHIFGRVQKKRIGTFAEYLAVDQGDIALIPQSLTFTEAAALPLVGLTSYQALHDIMKLRQGDKILILGGSGGIGTVAIQIAKQLGAFVATTTSATNFELVKSLGADLVLDYRTTNFAEILKDYDYVLDTRGGQTLADSFKIIKPGGQVVSIAGLPNARFGREYGIPLWKRLAFGFVTRKLTRLEKQTGATYTFLFMKPSGAQLATLGQMVDAGTLRPIIDRVVPFDNIAEALHYSHSGQAKGKIILQMADDDRQKALQ